MNPGFVSEEMEVIIIIIRLHPFRRLHKFFPTIWSHLTYLVFIAPPWFCKQLLFILLNKKFFTLLGQISCLQDNFRDWEREGSKTKNIVLCNHSAGCGLTKKRWFCLWQHNSLTQSKIRGSTELISSSGISSVSAGGGWWNSWANRSHIILLNSVASDHKQPYQLSRSYWTTSAPGCITFQEWDRKHKQNIDKTLPSSVCHDFHAPWKNSGGKNGNKGAYFKKYTGNALKCCVGAIRKQNLSVYFIRWVFCFLKAALAAPVWTWKQWRSLCEVTVTIAFPVNRLIPIRAWVDSFTEAACQNLNHY